MSSPAAPQMLDNSEITSSPNGCESVIPRDKSVPWSSIDLYGTNNGDHSEPSRESRSSSSEGEMSAFNPDIDNGNASTDVTSNTNAENGSVCEGHCRATSPEVPKAIANLPWPVLDDMLPCIDHELKIEDEDGTETLALITDLGDSTPAGSATQASNILQSFGGGAYVLSKCITQTHGHDELRIGQGGEILRWRKGLDIPFVICTESFKDPDAAALVGDAVKEAISMWGRNIGVNFRRVCRDGPATFQIKYQQFPDNNNPNVYALSFFPQRWPGSLFIYQRALKNADYLVNILAHEFGHILGLRHEFAAKEERDVPSVCFGSENDQSVMNYFKHLSQHQVGKQDLEELAAFYAYGQADYQGLPIVDITPHLHIFGESGNAPQEISPCIQSAASPCAVRQTRGQHLITMATGGFLLIFFVNCWLFWRISFIIAIQY